MLMMVLGLVACDRGAPAAPVAETTPAASAPKPADGGRMNLRIEKKTEVLKREDREADVHYPVFSGLPPAILKELQASAGLKAGTDSSLEEWKAELQEQTWLVEIDYEVTYNRHDLLCLTYWIEGMGAHPSTSTKDLAADLKTGRRLAAKDLFKPASLEELAAKVDRLRSAAVEKAIQEHRPHLEENEMTEEYLAEAMEPAVQSRFGTESLDRFRLSDKGVTFVYDFEFPHVHLALEPSGEYFLSYEELRPYVDPKGPLSRVIG
jgi:hypothetical protein